jgi:hemoglobin
MTTTMKSTRALAPLLALLLAAGAGCEDTVNHDGAPKSKPPASGAPSATDTRPLYERLGGEASIGAVVDTFLANVAADPLIGKRFEGANLPRLRDLLVQQICAATGGPQMYKGRDMKTVHAGMGIVDAEFDALVADLGAALDKHGAGAREKRELLSALAPMRADIVERPPSPEERIAQLESRLSRAERAIDLLNQRLEAFAAADDGGAAGGKAPMAGKSGAAGKSGMEKPSMAKPPAEGGKTSMGGKSAMAGKSGAAEGGKKMSPKFDGFTAEEKALAADLIKRYTEAEAKQGEARGDLMGSKLEQTKFFAMDGSILDLKELEGKKKVVLVIMRGFAGTVCINCSTQTISLSDNIEAFRSRNAEVVLVYPGEAETLPTFLDAVRSLRDGFAPPFPVVLDVDLAAVRTFRIEGSLAKPTSLVLDEQGVVRYAYVGKQPADRPSVKDLLAALDGIDGK